MALSAYRRDLTHSELSFVYRWVDSIPLSRPKKNIHRDFADAVLLSELLHYHYPSLVDLHNYSSTSSLTMKEYNWKTLNGKVLKKINAELAEEDIKEAINASKGAIEKIILYVKERMTNGEKNEKAQMQQMESKDNQPISNTGSVSTISTISTTSKAAPPPETPASAHATKSSKAKHSSAAAAAAPSASLSSASSAPPSAERKQSLPAVSEKKDELIAHLKETVEILQEKISKLEQLVRFKNAKIDTLNAKIDELNKNQQAPQPANISATPNAAKR